MSLPASDAERQRTHQRTITFEGFRRADGLWDIEGRLVDVKDHPLDLKSEIRHPGDAVHDISVRITIDQRMNVVDIATSSDATPFPEVCPDVLPNYRQVIGLNLLQGFVKVVKNTFGNTRGCTHVSELLMGMPTAAFQTFSGQVRHEERSDTDEVPHHLDRCHALATDSAVVQRLYPRWYRPKNPG